MAGNQKTFVLVHGGWFGGWCWRRVIDPLRQRGHKVFAPTLTGLGERKHLISKDITSSTHINDIINVIHFERLSDVVLVGHSFGGGTITGVADRLKGSISTLVYLDALILQSGQSPFDVNPPEVANARRKLSLETSNGLTIPVPDHSTWGIPDEDVSWVKKFCVPHPTSTWESKLILNNPVGNTLPAIYVASANPYYYPTKASRDYARTRSDWKYMEIPTGHCPMISHPDLVVDLLANI